MWFKIGMRLDVQKDEQTEQDNNYCLWLTIHHLDL